MSLGSLTSSAPVSAESSAKHLIKVLLASVKRKPGGSSSAPLLRCPPAAPPLLCQYTKSPPARSALEGFYYEQMTIVTGKLHTRRH